MEEIWKDILGYEGIYQVSNLGNVKSLDRDYIAGSGSIIHRNEHFIKPSKNTKGYLIVRLFKNGKSRTMLVHRLVAEAFIPNPDNKPQVDHINGDKKLNVVSNLRWATNEENCRNPNTIWKTHRLHTEEWKQRMSTLKKGKAPSKQCLEEARKKNSKSIEQYDKNGCLIESYDSLTEASISLGVSINSISSSIKRNGTCNGCYWKLASNP